MLAHLERFNRLRTLSLLQKHAVCRQQPLKGPLLIDWKVQCNRAYARWCRRLWWGHRGGSGSGGHGCVGYVCGAGFGLVVVVIDVDFGAARVRAPIIVKCLWFHRLLPRFSTNILVSPSQIFVASLRQWWSLCLSLCLSWYWCWLRSGNARGEVFEVVSVVEVMIEVVACWWSCYWIWWWWSLPWIWWFWCVCNVGGGRDDRGDLSAW